jgi:hypothetical protein
MTQEKHALWQAKRLEKSASGEWRWIVIKPDGMHLSGKHDEETAAFIVYACNRHNALMQAIITLRSVAAEAADLNDADHIKGNSHKAHKMLMALAGRIPGYRKDIDDAFSALHAACHHEFGPVGHTPYTGVYQQTCKKCGLTDTFEKDYT